ncbi:MAG: hypothetical protein QOH69_2921 [Actinomycetota bacterium]|jgi:hypothetical protein|nr:hypothetical protein [Actinomycetota bacterium]
MGVQPPRSVIQASDLDAATRVALWNSLHSAVEVMNAEGWNFNYSKPGEALLRDMWASELERPVDEFSTSRATAAAKELYLNGEWWAVLDNVQWNLSGVTRHWQRVGGSYREAISSDLSKYLVGFRILSDELIPVSNEIELAAIREAATTVGENARKHLQRATSLLASRENPQYAKVVQESVNAVESFVAELTGEHVLSVGLKRLGSSGLPTHQALLGAWDKLYGYTSDAGGIRHGLIRDEDVDQPLAVYFLVSCSAFINMLLKLEAAR